MEPVLCKCGKAPKVCQWTDTVKPNATWIECACGLITKTFYHEEAIQAQKLAMKMWNRKASKRTAIKGSKAKSCEKCGSKKVEINEYKLRFHNANEDEKFYAINCLNCGLGTDDMKEDGSLRTIKEALVLWNS